VKQDNDMKIGVTKYNAILKCFYPWNKRLRQQTWNGMCYSNENICDNKKIETQFEQLNVLETKDLGNELDIICSIKN